VPADSTISGLEGAAYAPVADIRANSSLALVNCSVSHNRSTKVNGSAIFMDEYGLAPCAVLVQGSLRLMRVNDLGVFFATRLHWGGSFYTDDSSLQVWAEEEQSLYPPQPLEGSRESRSALEPSFLSAHGRPAPVRPHSRRLMYTLIARVSCAPS
jgi:hypothetical protein